MAKKEVVKLEYGNVADVSINGESSTRFFVSESKNHCVTLKAVELGDNPINEIKLVIWTSATKNGK